MRHQNNVAYMVIFGLLISALHSLSAQQIATQQQKIAVLKINYDGFTDEEKVRVNTTFYDSLARDNRLMVMTEKEAREKLIPLGIEPAEIANEQGYIAAGRILEVDYVLVGTMDKIGDFVEVTFRTFKMPRGTQKRYPGGKTLDMLVKEEIPNIINLIYKDLDLPKSVPASSVQIPVETQSDKEPEGVPSKKVSHKWRWRLIAIGGVGSLVAVYFWSKTPPPPPPSALPRPPFVP